MISMIFAVGENYELGCNNKLLWHLKNDLINFKKLTLNKTIIMGRKTFESLGRLLPNRKHIVISNNYKTDLEDIEITNDVKEIINRYENSEEEVFILGGASIYKLFEDYASKLYITRVHEKFNQADVFYEYNIENFIEVDKVTYKKDEYNDYNYDIYTYVKI